MLVANSDGVLVDDEQVRTLFRISVVASGDTGLQTGYESLGHTIGFELFDQHDVEELARRAAQRALTKLKARPAPSGSLPVVIRQGSGGVLFHEACGHGLEADLVGKGASVFKGRVGELVAAPMVTLVDDGTMSGEWGAIGYDDEGHVSQRNVLIEDGVLTDYMWDFLRARKEGRPQSGNGRRQSYMHLPMVRMTNTFVLNGGEEPDEIVRATDHGVYVAQLGGGQVNTASGDFVFGMTEAYLIENGEITDPIREGNLIGNGPQVLKDIDLLGNDFAMGSPGTCGKDGQGVPVGDGQPTLRVKALDHRWHGGLRRTAMDDLLELATGIAGRAEQGEQIEAYVARAKDTAVRVYEGEVEHFTSAQSEGVGIRVVRDGRIGFAYAGTLERDAVAEVLAEARDNVSFGTPDEWAGLASPGRRGGGRAGSVARGAAGPAHRRQDHDGQGAGAPHPRRRQPGTGGRSRLRRCASRRRGRHQHRHRHRRSGNRGLPVGQHPGRRRRRHPHRVRVHRGSSTGRFRPGEGGTRSGRAGDSPARRHQADYRRASRSSSIRSSRHSSSASSAPP